MSTRNTAEIIQLPKAATSKRVAAVKQIRAAVDKKLVHLVDGLSANVADALFEEMHHINEEQALSYHFNIMRALKTDATAMRDEFRTQMNQSWINLVHRKDKQSAADAPQEVAQSLKLYSDKNLNHYKILLEELRLRFCNLSHCEMAFHPLLPGNFYLSFWHATEALELNYQERMLLLPLFNRFVMDRFGQVLSIANQTMVELEIPAEPV